MKNLNYSHATFNFTDTQTGDKYKVQFQGKMRQNAQTLTYFKNNEIIGRSTGVGGNANKERAFNWLSNFLNHQ